MSEEKKVTKNSTQVLLIASAFIVITLVGILLTVKFANGSTAIGVAGGLATVALAWLSARWVNNRF